MKFCPKCEIRLRKQNTDSVLSCPKCGYNENQTGSLEKPVQNSEENEAKSDFNVLAENEGKETQSTIKIECEKCGNNEAIWWMLQTRSADEPTTQFYRCTKCDFTWRNYA